MNITTKNKQDIINEIIENELGIQLEHDVRETIKEMRHYKNVDKRFTDALDKKGNHAYILKDKYSSKLVIKKKIEDAAYISNQISYVEFTIYNSEVFEKRPFTWEQIEQEFSRYNYAKRLEDYNKMLINFDDELEQFKQFVEFIESKSFTFCDIWKVKSDLKDAVKYASKNRVRLTPLPIQVKQML